MRQTNNRIYTRRLPFTFGESQLSSIVFIALSIVLIGISAFRPQAFERLRTFTTDMFSPVFETVNMPFEQINIVLHDITNLAQLQADNLRLEQENSRLRDWYQTALLLDSENRSLRDLLNLDVDPSYEHISARILADAGKAYVKSLLLSVGTDKGVEKDAAVVSGEGLIGRIVEVGDHTSRILLISDINSRVPVVIEDTGQHAIMAGSNEYHPRLIHLPEDSEIVDSARVITSGYGGIYPQGLPVGRVSIDKQGSVNVVLFSDFNRLHVVRVLKEVQSSP